jgi:hypothetical protein
VTAGGFEFFTVEFDAEGVGRDLLSSGGKMENDEALCVAPGFFLGGSNGQQPTEYRYSAPCKNPPFPAD